MTEPTEEELERRARQLVGEWMSTRSEGPALSEEDQKIASKLMGATNAARRARHDGNRPFKVKRPIVTAEYYEVPPSSWSYIGGGWRIDVRENGILRNSRGGLSRVECITLIAKLEARGVTPKAIETEWMKQQPPEPKSASAGFHRKSFAERFGDFEGVAG